MGAVERNEYRFEPEYSVINQNGAIYYLQQVTKTYFIPSKEVDAMCIKKSLKELLLIKSGILTTLNLKIITEGKVSMIAIYARVSTEEQVTQNKPPLIFFPLDRHSVHYPCTTEAKGQ
ncbi:DUF5370 family protein [Fictibacillus sp. WQ 8-8]|uniref:DUF5370 family protein n=1 Tax=Fictibacillus sp. WQ 8-8 TaxID=2938788 RepID=UPI0035C74694